MGFIFSTVAEYDTEIEEVRTAMLKAVKGEKWRLNTSQSDQQVSMNMKEIREYLSLLTAEQAALYERGQGSSVTSIVYRRN